MWRVTDDPITLNEITDSLARALDRIEDFEAVQSGASSEELRDAVVVLGESVGIGDEARALLGERLEHLEDLEDAPCARGHVLLGLIVGLTAAELESGNAPAVRR